MKSARISLRFLTIEDAQAKLTLELKNRNIFEKVSMTRYSDFYTLLIQREIIELAAKNKENDREYSFGIFENDSKELIGVISLFHVFRGPLQRASLGYGLDKQFTNRGYTTEAVKLIVSYGFQKLELHRIEANVMPQNTASIRVLEKSGFHQEGVAQKNVHINGKWEDHQVMAIINSDD